MCVGLREKKKEESEVFRERKKGEKGEREPLFFWGKSQRDCFSKIITWVIDCSVVGEIAILDVNKKKTEVDHKITGSNLSKNNSFKNYLTLS